MIMPDGTIKLAEYYHGRRIKWINEYDEED